MAVIFDSGNSIWSQNLQDIFLEEPFSSMDGGMTLLVGDKDVSLIMPVYYNTIVKEKQRGLNK